MSATLGPRRAEAAVAEDAAAGTRALYERHGERVFSFCVSRLRDVEEAQDATQTTFLYAMRSLDYGVEPRFELAWLLAIAHNVCRSARRSRNRRDARVSYADVTELEAAAESMGDETGEELAWIRDALEPLPENQRRAILLREWQGLSYADIAAELHLSLAAVETLLFRARRALNRHLERAKRGLKALDLTSLGLLLRNAGEGAAVKTAVVGAGLAVAVGPLAVAEVSREARPAATAPAGVSHKEQPRPRAASRPRSTSRRPAQARAPVSRLSVVAFAGRRPPVPAPAQPALQAPATSTPSRPPTESPPAAGVSPPSPVQVVEDAIDGVAHSVPAVPVDPTGVVDAAPPLPGLGLPSP